MKAVALLLLLGGVVCGEGLPMYVSPETSELIRDYLAEHEGDEMRLEWGLANLAGEGDGNNMLAFTLPVGTADGVLAVETSIPRSQSALRRVLPRSGWTGGFGRWRGRSDCLRGERGA